MVCIEIEWVGTKIVINQFRPFWTWVYSICVCVCVHCTCYTIFLLLFSVISGWSHNLPLTAVSCEKIVQAEAAAAFCVILHTQKIEKRIVAMAQIMKIDSISKFQLLPVQCIAIDQIEFCNESPQEKPNQKDENSQTLCSASLFEKTKMAHSIPSHN